MCYVTVYDITSRANGGGILDHSKAVNACLQQPLSLLRGSPHSDEFRIQILSKVFAHESQSKDSPVKQGRINMEEWKKSS